MFKLFLLFAVVPIVEIYLFVLVGTEIGALNTVAVVILTAMLGAWLARTQGMQTLARIQANLQAGLLPTDELIDGAIILAAGLVLLTPGFFTDALGFLLLIPTTRDAFKRVLKKKLSEWAANGKVNIHFRNF